MQLRIQSLGASIHDQFLVMLPYAIAQALTCQFAILALVGLTDKYTTPTALGIPYFLDNRDH